MEAACPPQMVAMIASQRFGSSRPAALRGAVDAVMDSSYRTRWSDERQCEVANAVALPILDGRRPPKRQLCVARTRGAGMNRKSTERFSGKRRPAIEHAPHDFERKVTASVSRTDERAKGGFYFAGGSRRLRSTAVPMPATEPPLVYCQMAKSNCACGSAASYSANQTGRPPRSARS